MISKSLLNDYAEGKFESFRKTIVLSGQTNFKTVKDLTCAKHSLVISDACEQMLEQVPDFDLESGPSIIDLVPIKELGFDNGDSRDCIYKRGEEVSLKTLSMAEALQLILEITPDTLENLGELFIATDPIKFEGRLHTLVLTRRGEGLFLDKFDEDNWFFNGFSVAFAHKQEK